MSSNGRLGRTVAPGTSKSFYFSTDPVDMLASARRVACIPIFLP